MKDKLRLDKAMVLRGLAGTRSQAESYIRLGKVAVNKKIIVKAGTMVSSEDKIRLTAKDQYVSRAGLKLASVAKALKLDFRGKVVLDVGSSTGGFTDYALRRGARKVIAVDNGTNQLHPSLRGHPGIELHEKTDIRDIGTLPATPEIILIDVSFISLRQVLPSIAKLSGEETLIVAMAKPQFEAFAVGQKHKGVIKNDSIRREILREFESWVKRMFTVLDKSDSKVAGAKGNLERFYLLRITPRIP